MYCLPWSERNFSGGLYFNPLSFNFLLDRSCHNVQDYNDFSVSCKCSVIVSMYKLFGDWFVRKCFVFIRTSMSDVTRSFGSLESIPPRTCPYLTLKLLFWAQARHSAPMVCIIFFSPGVLRCFFIVICICFAPGCPSGLWRRAIVLVWSVDVVVNVWNARTQSVRWIFSQILSVLDFYCVVLSLCCVSSILRMHYYS